MNQVIQFGSAQVVTVKDENVGGILLDIKALKVDGVTVAPIADLNAIPLVVKVHRNGSQEPKTIYNNYLDYILRGLHGGSTRYGINTTATTDGFLIRLDFNGSVPLRKGDFMTIECKAPVSAFTDLASANSEINIETIPASKNTNGLITIVEALNYGNGADSYNDVLGNAISKIVLVHDLSANYSASTEAKPTTGIDLTAQGYENKASENLLYSENLNALQFNPETAVKDLVIYNDVNLLNKAKLKVKYNKAVLTTARIVLLKKAFI